MVFLRLTGDKSSVAALKLPFVMFRVGFTHLSVGAQWASDEDVQVTL